MNASKTLGVLTAALIAGTVSSAYADPWGRHAGHERWSGSSYGDRYDAPRRVTHYDEHRLQPSRVIVERTVVERPVYTERRFLRPPVREVIVERPVYVERAPVYPQPYGYGYPAAHATVSPGAVGGAIVGAIIGSQVGHGPNRAATTAAGAVIGGVIGGGLYR